LDQCSQLNFTEEENVRFDGCRVLSMEPSGIWFTIGMHLVFDLHFKLVCWYSMVSQTGTILGEFFIVFLGGLEWWAPYTSHEILDLVGDQQTTKCLICWKNL
jgi:hypothetical protein